MTDTKVSWGNKIIHGDLTVLGTIAGKLKDPVIAKSVEITKFYGQEIEYTGITIDGVTYTKLFLTEPIRTYDLGVDYLEDTVTSLTPVLMVGDNFLVAYRFQQSLEKNLTLGLKYTVTPPTEEQLILDSIGVYIYRMPGFYLLHSKTHPIARTYTSTATDGIVVTHSVDTWTDPPEFTDEQWLLLTIAFNGYVSGGTGTFRWHFARGSDDLIVYVSHVV